MALRSFGRALNAVAATLCLTVAAPTSASAVVLTDAAATSINANPTPVAIYERQIDDLGIPNGFVPFLRSDARVDSGRDVSAHAAPDLNGDGTPEVMEVDLRYSYAIAEDATVPSLEYEAATRVIVRNGKTGRSIWKKRYDDDAWPIATSIGDDGRPGVVMVRGLWSQFGSARVRYVTLEALDGRRGSAVWTREYRSTSASSVLGDVSENGPMMIALFDAIDGDATDVMVALGTRVVTPDSNTVTTRVVVIDGRNGIERPHPTIDVGFDWWPLPYPAGDLDGDGLADYVTTNQDGVDLGQGQESPNRGPAVFARRGVDGTPIWTTTGIKMEDFALGYGTANVVGSKTTDVALMTYKGNSDVMYLLDGHYGTVRWVKNGYTMSSPGDLDGDRRPDVLLLNAKTNSAQGWRSFSQTAVRGVGTRIWDRGFKWHADSSPCPHQLCIGLGSTRTGWTDVQPDGVWDTLVFMTMHQTELFTDKASFLLNGKTGRVLLRDDAELQSPGVAVDRKGLDLIRFEDRDDPRLGAVNGKGRTLWRMDLRTERLVRRTTGFSSSGFTLPKDRCGDVVVNVTDGNDFFYAVIDGASGRVLWSRWISSAKARPRVVGRIDKNRAC